MPSDYYRVTDWRTRMTSLGHSVGLIAGAFLVGIVLMLASGQLLLLGDVIEPGMETAEMPPLAVVVLTASQFVGFAVAVFAYLRWRGEVDLFDVGIPSLRDLGWTVAGFVGVFAVAILVGQLLRVLGVQTATNQVVELGRSDPTFFLYMIPVTLLFVAPAEELLVRGTVQGLLRRAYGVVPAVIVASLLFGIAHYFALTGSGGGKVAYIAVAAGLGLVLGTVYELTENLTVPIVVHGLWNTFLFGSQYLVATGAVQA